MKNSITNTNNVTFKVVDTLSKNKIVDCYGTYIDTNGRVQFILESSNGYLYVTDDTFDRYKIYRPMSLI